MPRLMVQFTGTVVHRCDSMTYHYIIHADEAVGMPGEFHAFQSLEDWPIPVGARVSCVKPVGPMALSFLNHYVNIAAWWTAH